MASTATALRIMIVDDHFVVRSGLVASLELEDSLRVVAEVARGEDVVAGYREHLPDIVLMDLQLPGMGGIAAITALRGINPRARILVFSTFARDHEILAALDAGASGYLQKSATRDDLLIALRTVAGGGEHVPPEIAQRLKAQRTGPTITSREREILQLIAIGRANKEIGDALAISEDTVKRHVSHILQKLEVHDRAQATAEAIRRGIIELSS